MTLKNAFTFILRSGFTFLILFSLLACGNGNLGSNRGQEVKNWKNNNGKVKVLSTIAMIDDLVKRIGGEHIDTLTLIKGELDPHSYQLVKGDDEKFAFADIIFFNGLGLEHGPSLQSHLNNNRKVIALGNAIQQQHSETIIYNQNQVDPHIWMDIQLWAKTVPFIVNALSERDPTHRDYFQKNGADLIAEMEKQHEEIRQYMQKIPDNQRYLVTSHDAFHYFTRAYLSNDEELRDNSWQKRCAAPEGLAPESQLSTADIQWIIDHMSKYEIHMLFPESNVSKDSIRKIISAGREKGLDLRFATPYLYGDAMGPPGSSGDTYLKMIRHNAYTIADCLKND